MKKLLSLFLVLCMLVSCCAIFSSCAKVKVKDVEKDAQLVLSEAMEKTSQEFFEDDADLRDVMEAAFKTGSFNITVESDTLMGDVKKVSETLYMNEEGRRVVSDTVVKYGADELAGRIYIDPNGLTVSSESILGSNKAYALNYASFAEKFSGSTIAQMLEIPAEAAAQIETAINELKSELTKTAETARKDAEKMANDLLALLQQVASEEKVENGEGDEVKCIVIKYTINNQTLKAALEKVLTEYSVEETQKQELLTSFDQLNNMATINLSAEIAINKKTYMIEKMDLDGTVTVKSGLEEQTASVNVDVLFTETKISLDASATLNGETASVAFSITKASSKKETVYTISATAAQGEVALKLLNATYTYTKSSGDFALAVDMGEDETNRTKFTVKGNMSSSKNEATIQINSVETDSVAVSIKITLKYVAKIDTPAAPSDAKDVVTLTENDIATIMEEIQNSKLGKIISSAQ